MSGKIVLGASRCWWALVAGGRAARRSFAAWQSEDGLYFEPLSPILVEERQDMSVNSCGHSKAMKYST